MFASFTNIWWNILFYVITLIAVFVLWMKRKHEYWTRRGVPVISPIIPFGNLASPILQKIPLPLYMHDLYQKTKGAYVGFYHLHRPILLIKDLDFIKDVLLKQYSSFEGHGFRPSKNADLLSQHLFNLEGEEWKNMRVKLTPTFTSSKMKYMFETMAKCADEMVDYIKTEMPSGGVMKVKDLLAKYSTDVIGSCAFGIEMNCFKYPDAEFRSMGKRIFKPGMLRHIVYIQAVMWPKLVQLFQGSINDAQLTQFFTKIIPETLKYREDNNIVRKDFLQMLIDMKNSNTGESITVTEIIPQVFVFFAAGFETSSNTATYSLFELAKNPKIQSKLRCEIQNKIRENDGKVTYDCIQNMQYLTQTIQEALRIYPAVPILTRFCSKPYTIPDTKTIIEPSTEILISVLGIQRDPEIYPDPMKFDPDRFTPENVAARHQFSFIPFGEGPRICIGSRFGMLQVKLALTLIILSYEISLCEDTTNPLEYDPTAFPMLLQTKGELLLKFTKIAN